MKALQWHGPHDVRVVHDAPVPRITGPRDTVVRVTRSAICGTDLHPYHGEIPGFTAGTVTGHEFTGVVEEVGAGVRGVAPGDRVVASDVIACGECWYCRQGWHYQCERVGLFGYDTVVGAEAVAGGHAEFVRVPYADVVLLPIPDQVSDEQALFVGDVLTTGYTCAERGEIRPGDVVAVVGCGPVGLMALCSALLMGASRVIAIDPVDNRRTVAETRGAIALAPGDDLESQVRDLTDGRGADVVLEAVGVDAALRSARELVRPRGTVCVVGSHASTAFPMPTGLAFGKELTLRFAVGDPISSGERVMRLVRDGRLDPTFVVSHRTPLVDAADAFNLFASGAATKVILVP